MYKHVADDNQIDANVKIGQTEGEITEHSIRKVMECLIHDFPLNSSVPMFDENINNG